MCSPCRGIALVARDGGSQTLPELLNLRRELSQTLRVQGAARSEPIALHVLRSVDDPPETCGLELSTVTVGLFGT